MKKKRVVIILSAIIVLLLQGCGPMKLLPVKVDEHGSLDGYRYFYINMTGTTVSSSTVGVSISYRLFVSDDGSTINPADYITGYLLKMGYVRVAELPLSYPQQTFIVSYGEGSRRHRYEEEALLDESCQEVIIQFISAETNEVICTITGEGIGNTRADDIRNALKRCLDAYFKVESDKEVR